MFLRANPVVIGILIFLTIVSVVFGALAIHMSRSGASLKPLVFMGVLLGLVAGPQIAFHLAQASRVIPKRRLAWTFGKDRPHAGWVERDDALATERGRFVNLSAAFGEGVDSSLVADLRRAGPGSPFADAEIAQMAVIPPASSAIIARFRDGGGLPGAVLSHESRGSQKSRTLA